MNKLTLFISIVFLSSCTDQKREYLERIDKDADCIIELHKAYGELLQAYYLKSDSLYRVSVAKV